MKHPTFAYLVGMGLISLGCAKQPGKNAKTPSGTEAVGTGQTTSATLGGDGAGAGQADGAPLETDGLVVSDAIARACGLPRVARTSYATKFEFDSAAVPEPDRPLLAAIAKCLTEGALRGRAVSLVGRCDARGEMEYNRVLGQSRADAVRRYLQDMGVAQAKLAATSRGELDARGTDEATMADDRRVDVALAD